jgi:hypothetical protein
MLLQYLSMKTEGKLRNKTRTQIASLELCVFVRQSAQLCLDICGLCYKPMTIVNDDSRVANKLEASLTDDARAVIYDYLMFIVQATVRPSVFDERLQNEAQKHFILV